METGTGINIKEAWEGQRTYRTVIKEGKLPVYEQAARQTGYGVKVTARAGEEILIDHRMDLNMKPDKAKVSPGDVQVTITVPLSQERIGIGPFDRAVEQLRLRQSPK